MNIHLANVLSKVRLFVFFSANGPGKPSSSQYIECVVHMSRVEISFK